MGYKCAAVGCDTGYDKTETSVNGEKSIISKIPEGVTFLKFPLNNPELCKKWEKNLRRGDFKATKYSRLCSLHFQESDFDEERHDSNKSRQNKLGTVRKQRKLKLSAVPSIWPNLAG